MSTAPSALIAASALVIFMLGAVHMLYTFAGTKLHPRDHDLIARLQEAHPQLTRQTTMWNAWVGFNASHSLGALLFGAIYGYLALVQPAFLFASWYLLSVGMFMLLSYAALGKRYWFSIPFRGIFVATVLYAAALVIAAA